MGNIIRRWRGGILHFPLIRILDITYKKKHDGERCGRNVLLCQRRWGDGSEARHTHTHTHFGSHRTLRDEWIDGSMDGASDLYHETVRITVHVRSRSAYIQANLIQHIPDLPSIYLVT